jgi:hypothetical protein
MQLRRFQRGGGVTLTKKRERRTNLISKIPWKKTPVGSKHKSQNNIKINVIEFGSEFVLSIDLAASIWVFQKF